ncbi:MAG TPA: helix-turn-helix domain-containing protein, partial [Bacteroidetes bacterium]|nr:helix-turn-helix domain-containing protein [Bacteroidota bacterium]
MLPQNLKYLRKKHHISQRDLAEAVELARSTIGDYERGRSEPDIKTLIRLTDYFKISLDDLILKDLKKEDYEIIRNKDFRVLAITVNKDEKENIELVNTKAEAGYIEGFNDPEYVRDLPKLYFPNIPEGTYRAFEIHGDSMLPMEPGSIVICSYVENMLDIKNGKTYVVVSKSGGLVYKRV